MGRCIIDRYLIKVDEALLKSFNEIQKTVNRIYGCCLEPEIFEKMVKALDGPYRKTTANIDINELNVVLKDIFPHGLNGMIDYSVKRVGMKISEAITDYATQAEPPYQLSKINIVPVFIREFINSYFFKDIIKVAYKVTQKISDRIMDEDSSLESGFISAEELKDDINECINNDPAFWEDFSSWPYKKKDQYLKSWRILCFLCACFMHLYLKENISLSEWLLIIKWEDIIMYVVTNFTEKEKI